MDDNTRSIKMLTLRLLSECPAEIQELFAEAQAAQEAANVERYGQKDAPGPQDQVQSNDATTKVKSPVETENIAAQGASPPTDASAEKRRFRDMFRRKPASPPPTSHPDATIYHTLRVATFDSKFFRHNRHSEEQGGYVAYNASHFGWEYFIIKAVRQGADGVWYHAGHFNRNKNDRIWELPIRLEPTRFSRGRVQGYLEHAGAGGKPAAS